MPPEPHPTALTSRHRELGARLVDFAGWEMPLEFAGTVREHQEVRASVGVFDVSHLGTVWVHGDGALATVSATFTNDPARLRDGQSQYTLCCDDRGGIVDDLIVYRIRGDRWMVVPNAANTAAVVAALREQARPFDATVDNGSHEHAILAVQGPRALATVAAALEVDVSAVAYLGLTEVELSGEQGLVCRTGYTGEPGCELVLPDAAALPAFDALLAAGAAPAGLGARDTLRLEMGYPLHGNDIDRDTNPYEARLGWAVKLDHGAFGAAQALRALREAGPGRRLWGLRGSSRRPLRAGLSVTHDGATVGSVTSGSWSPVLGVGIGLAYLDDPLGPGDEVTVDVRGSELTFAVVRPPFVERDPTG